MNMKKEVSESVHLLKKANENHLYGKLVVQLQKDFERINVPIKIPDGINAEELETTLNEKIYFLLMERFPDYLNLLYAIDIPESVFEKIEVTDAVDVSKQITFFILERELQKVELREKYNS